MVRCGMEFGFTSSVLRYMLLPPERVLHGSQEELVPYLASVEGAFERREEMPDSKGGNAGKKKKKILLLCATPSPGSEELACGSQAFIATLLFDPSMSALPIIVKQNSPSVGLFTH